jgi:hypothetical protein
MWSALRWQWYLELVRLSSARQTIEKQQDSIGRTLKNNHPGLLRPGIIRCIVNLHFQIRKRINSLGFLPSEHMGVAEHGQIDVGVSHHWKLVRMSFSY